ncbi:MAG: hypothetical protein Q9182_003488 [Xanthomendoza sp. 2 TL-2023]
MAPTLPRTYKAAIFKKANDKLTIEDVELKQPEQDAQYCLLRSEATVSVPADVDPAAFCPLLCAGVTVFNSMRRQSIPAGETVAIQGLGGLGHLAIQYASKMGYRVVALSSSGAKKEFAQDLGADDYIDGSKEDHAEALQKLGGASLIVSTSPSPESIGKLIGGLGLLGKLLILPACGEVSIDTVPMVMKGLSVTSWPAGHATDSEEAISFARLHNINCMIEKFPLEKANEAYEHMLNGKARSEMNHSHERILVPPHTPKPLPNHLRFELTSALLSNSAIPVIQSTLYDGSRDSGWIDAVRERAKQLISTGQATTSQQVMEQLVKEARDRSKSQPNIQGGLAHHQKSERGVQATSGPAPINIRFPEQAIIEGKKAVRTALKDIVEVAIS